MYAFLPYVIHLASKYTTVRSCHEYRHPATSTAMPPASMPTELHEVQAQQYLYIKNPATTGQTPYPSEPTGESETDSATIKNDSLAMDPWHSLIRREREFAFVRDNSSYLFKRPDETRFVCPKGKLV